MKTTIKQVKAGFKLTIKSAIESVKPMTYLAATREACEAERAGFEALMVEFEADATLKIARARYRLVQERAHVLENAHPNLYLVDEVTSVENAADGMIQNHGVDIRNKFECEWPALAFHTAADCLIADTAYRCAENGIDGSAYGFTY